jgi:hypothetical protein
MPGSEIPSVWEAAKAWPFYVLHCWSWRTMMGRSATRPARRVTVAVRFGPREMSLSNLLYLWSHDRAQPWFARYPRWAASIGSCCGMSTAGGDRCEIAGLGHAGPHRLAPRQRGLAMAEET